MKVRGLGKALMKVRGGAGKALLDWQGTDTLPGTGQALIKVTGTGKAL